MASKEITICVLCYGNRLDLARRCLGSIGSALPHGKRYVDQFRLALNEPSDQVRRYVHEFAQKVWTAYKIPSRIYEAARNAGKYPMMRVMFHRDPPLPTPRVMWFDDDAWFDHTTSDWWEEMLWQARQYDMIGKQYLMGVQGNQLEWVAAQPWCTRPGAPPWRMRNQRPAFKFCQGSWWVISTAVLQKFNWPIPELHHIGGDSMLGELFRQQHLSMGVFYGGVWLNSDGRKQHDTSRRRGINHGHHVGFDYVGLPLPTDHQNFNYTVHEVGGRDETEELVSEQDGQHASGLIQLFDRGE